MTFRIRFALILFAIWPMTSMAATNDEPLHMLVFSSEACPHCQAQKPFIQSLDESHDELAVIRVEVRRDAAGRNPGQSNG